MARHFIRIAPFVLASCVFGCSEDEPVPVTVEDTGTTVDSSVDTGTILEDSGTDTTTTDTTTADTATPDTTMVDAPAEASAPKGTADIQLLTISDWHGQLEAYNETDNATGVTTKFSGIAALSGYFKAARTANPLTLTLMAGDAFGATTLLSTYGSATR